MCSRLCGRDGPHVSAHDAISDLAVRRGLARIASMSNTTSLNLASWRDTMPRYYFALHGSGASDLEGQDFPNDEAARIEAQAVARDLSQNRNPASDERIVVTNEKGEVIHVEPLFHR